jgi:hypothetical protein
LNSRENKLQKSKIEDDNKLKALNDMLKNKEFKFKNEDEEDL